MGLMTIGVLVQIDHTAHNFFILRLIAAYKQAVHSALQRGASAILFETYNRGRTDELACPPLAPRTARQLIQKKNIVVVSFVGNNFDFWHRAEAVYERTQERICASPGTL